MYCLKSINSPFCVWKNDRLPISDSITQCPTWISVMVCSLILSHLRQTIPVKLELLLIQFLIWFAILYSVIVTCQPKKWKLKTVLRHRYSGYPFFLEVHEDSAEIQDLLWKSSINLPNNSWSRSIFLFNLECYCGCGSSIGFVYTRKISREGRKDVKTLRLSQFLCLLNGNFFVPYYCRTN